MRQAERRRHYVEAIVEAALAVRALRTEQAFLRARLREALPSELSAAEAALKEAISESVDSGGLHPDDIRAVGEAIGEDLVPKRRRRRVSRAHTGTAKRHDDQVMNTRRPTADEYSWSGVSAGELSTGGTPAGP